MGWMTEVLISSRGKIFFSSPQHTLIIATGYGLDDRGVEIQVPEG
jgi:hypothetical protein